MTKETNTQKGRERRAHSRTHTCRRHRSAIYGLSDESRKVYSRNACGLNNSADAKVVRRPNQIFLIFQFLIFFLIIADAKVAGRTNKNFSFYLTKSLHESRKGNSENA